MNETELFLVVHDTQPIIIDYVVPFAQACKEAGVMELDGEWDRDDDPNAPRDANKGRVKVLVSYLIPKLGNLRDLGFFTLLTELKKFGRLTTIREVLATVRQSDVLKGLLCGEEQELEMLITALPALGMILDDGRAFAGVCRRRDGVLGIIPMGTRDWGEGIGDLGLMNLKMPKNLFIVITEVL